MGPNGANFWSCVPTLIQIQANYNSQMVKHLKQKSRNGPYAIYPSEQSQKEFNAYIKNKDTLGPIAVLAPGCRNYYTVSRLSLEILLQANK